VVAERVEPRHADPGHGAIERLEERQIVADEVAQRHAECDVAADQGLDQVAGQQIHFADGVGLGVSEDEHAEAIRFACADERKVDRIGKRAGGRHSGASKLERRARGLVDVMEARQAFGRKRRRVAAWLHDEDDGVVVDGKPIAPAPVRAHDLPAVRDRHAAQPPLETVSVAIAIAVVEDHAARDLDPGVPCGLCLRKAGCCVRGEDCPDGGQCEASRSSDAKHRPVRATHVPGDA
jgi:hypothetical protein